MWPFKSKKKQEQKSTNVTETEGDFNWMMNPANPVSPILMMNPTIQDCGGHPDDGSPPRNHETSNRYDGPESADDSNGGPTLSHNDGGSSSGGYDSSSGSSSYDSGGSSSDY